MPDLEDRQALWATPLEEQRRRDAEAERAAEARNVPPPPEDVPPADPVSEPAEPDGQPWRPLVAITFFALAFAVLVIATTKSEPVRTDVLSSSWGSIPMSCDTSRFDDGPRRVETFTCRATGLAELPPGTYTSGGFEPVTWDSDYDRRSSRATEIRIDADGVLRGWARY